MKTLKKKKKKKIKYRQLTDLEQTTLDKVCRKIAPRFAFSYYTADDIYQEAYLVGWSIIPLYVESKGPLENFLTVSIVNRLKNTVRKVRGDKEKRKIIDARSLLVGIPIDMGDELELQEMLEKIDQELPIAFREDYLKMRDNMYISKQRRLEIIEEIKKILRLELCDGELDVLEKEQESTPSTLIFSLDDLTSSMKSSILKNLSSINREFFLKYNKGLEITHEENISLLTEINLLLNKI